MPASKQSPGSRFLFQFRISEEEHNAFKARAAACKTNPSGWARTILRRDAGLWTGGEAPAVTPETVRAQVQALGTIGDPEERLVRALDPACESDGSGYGSGYGYGDGYGDGDPACPAFVRREA